MTKFKIQYVTCIGDIFIVLSHYGSIVLRCIHLFNHNHRKSVTVIKSYFKRTKMPKVEFHVEVANNVAIDVLLRVLANQNHSCVPLLNDNMLYQVMPWLMQVEQSSRPRKRTKTIAEATVHISTLPSGTRIACTLPQMDTTWKLAATQPGITNLE